MSGAIPRLPQYTFMAWCSVEAQGQLYLLPLRNMQNGGRPCYPLFEDSSCSSSDAEYEGVSKSFRTGHLERELQMVQLSATRCNCVTIL